LTLIDKKVIPITRSFLYVFTHNKDVEEGRISRGPLFKAFGDEDIANPKKRFFTTMKINYFSLS